MQQLNRNILFQLYEMKKVLTSFMFFHSQNMFATLVVLTLIQYHSYFDGFPTLFNTIIPTHDKRSKLHLGKNIFAFSMFS